jgi:serine/threonine-protein kinase SRK2
VQLLAVKFVPRPLPKAAIPLMMAEVELQAQLGEGHVNIITMRELMLTRTHLGLVMDYASGECGGVGGGGVGVGVGGSFNGGSGGMMCVLGRQS